MPRPDKLLQAKIEELEQGKPLDEVLHSLRKNEQELASLIRMADQVKSLSHPELNPVETVVHHQKIMAAFSQMPKTHLQRKATRPSFKWPFSWEALHQQLSSTIFKYGLATGLVAIAVVLGLLFYNLGPVAAQTVTLADVNGIVEVIDAQNTASANFATSGERVHQGKTIKTYADSSVTLSFYDGSHMTLGADTTVNLTQLRGNWNHSLQVQLTQTQGTTASDVVPLTPNDSYFQVNTPSGQALVQGTAFEVTVSPDGNSTFFVKQGNVQVSADGGIVHLASGQITLVSLNSAPQSASFQFKLQGVLQSVIGNSWVVARVAFRVNEQTTIFGQSHIGDYVSVVGRALSNSNWTADQVILSQPGNEYAQFTGVVNEISTTSMRINGKTVMTDANTEISPYLKLGNPVQVTFYVTSAANWLATNISTQITSSNPIGTTNSESSTATSTTGENEIESSSPTTGEATPNILGQPSSSNNNTYCTDYTLHQPRAEILAEEYGVDYTEIIKLFCRGYGFGEIDLAYSLSLQYYGNVQHVQEIFTMREDGQSWGQIMQSLKATQAANQKKSDNSIRSIPVQPTRPRP